VIRAGFSIFYGTLNAAMAQNLPNNVLQQGGVSRQERPNLVRYPFPPVSFAALADYTALPRDWSTVIPSNGISKSSSRSAAIPWCRSATLETADSTLRAAIT
jgi:hypothetical protein